MSPRTLAVIVLALVFGMLSAFAVYQLAVRPPEVKQVEEEEVYVAKENIDPGTVIDESMVVKKGFPKDRLPLNAVKSTDGFKDRMVRIGILKDDPIDTRRLGNPGEMQLAVMFNPGEVAFTTAVADSAALGSGFILPQSFVDVLVSLKGGGSNRNDDPELAKAITNLLLQRVQVLAVGQQLAAPKESKLDESKSRLRTVTLRVNHDQAALMQQASSMGTLHLVLRHPKDDKIYDVKPVGEMAVRRPGEQEENLTPTVDGESQTQVFDKKLTAMREEIMAAIAERDKKKTGSKIQGEEEENPGTDVRVMKGSTSQMLKVFFDKAPEKTEAPKQP